MIKYYIFFLYVFLFLNSCTPVNKSHNISTSGTTILMWSARDSFILAADSRSQHLSSDFIKKYTDTSRKIFHVNKTFFMLAGVSSTKQENFQQTIKKSYNASISLSQNANNINEILRKKLQDYYDSLPITIRKFAFVKDTTVNDLTIIMATYQKSNLVCAVISLDLKTDNNYNAKIISKPADIDTNFYGFRMAGYKDNLKKLLHTGNLMNRMGTTTLTKLITYEARFSKEVDSNVNYYIVKQNGFKYGKNY